MHRSLFAPIHPSVEGQVIIAHVKKIKNNDNNNNNNNNNTCGLSGETGYLVSAFTMTALCFLRTLRPSMS